MIEALVGLFATLLQAILAAGDDTEAKQDALMAAEEKLAHMRAQAKFG